MCECYKIGGRFIAEDPDCPIHGTEAQSRQRLEEYDRQALEERVADLETKVDYLLQEIERLSLTGNE